MTERTDPRRRNTWWPAVVYVLLLAVGIPWYWPADNYTLVFGMPAWVIVAIVASVFASVFTAWLLRVQWPGEREQGND